MTACYITSDHPLYLLMTMTAVGSLRHHNPSLPVKVIFINHALPWPRIRVRKGDFLDFCRQNGAEVLERPAGWFGRAEADIWVFRHWLKDLPGDGQILYLESDTLVAGDLGPLFEKYRDHDIVAVPSEWVRDQGWGGFLGPMPYPFNPGIVLWNHGHHRRWASSFLGMTEDLQSGDGPLTHWLYRTHPAAKHAEELTLNLYALESGLRWDYFTPEEADVMKHDHDYLRRPLLFHTYSAHWRRVVSHRQGRGPRLIGGLVK